MFMKKIETKKIRNKKKLENLLESEIFHFIPVSSWPKSSTKSFICSKDTCSAFRMTSRRRMQVFKDFAFNQILPLMPATSSNWDSFDNMCNKRHFSFKSFRTRFMLQGNMRPSLSSPRLPFFPVESTHTNSGSRSEFATTTLQQTTSPTFSSGRFFFVAPSKARYERAKIENNVMLWHFWLNHDTLTCRLWIVDIHPKWFVGSRLNYS